MGYIGLVIAMIAVGGIVYITWRDSRGTERLGDALKNLINRLPRK
jgi:hypothetical protein